MLNCSKCNKIRQNNLQNSLVISEQLLFKCTSVHDKHSLVDEAELVLLEFVSRKPLGSVVSLHHINHSLLKLFIELDNVALVEGTFFVHLQKELAGKA